MTSPASTAAARALAARIGSAGSGRNLTHRRGVVTAVPGGTPALVTVQLTGGTVTVNLRYLHGYAPTVGDTVEILTAGATKFAVKLA
jgi:hypothetical protein